MPEGPRGRAAAGARLVRFGHGLAGQHEFDRFAQGRAGDRATGARTAAVELPAPGETPVGVVEEEVRRAGAAVRLGDLLRRVDQIGKREAGARGLVPQVVGVIVGVPVDVVAADADRGEAMPRQFLEERAQGGLDVLHVGTVIGQEHHEQGRRVGEVLEGDGPPVERRQAEVRRGRPEGHHVGGNRHIGIIADSATRTIPAGH